MLNLWWDELVDIIVLGVLNVIVIIWDYDMFGEYDFVGWMLFKLDLVYFGDYLLREFWLDFDI